MRTFSGRFKQFHARRTVAGQATGSNRAAEAGSSTLTGRVVARRLGIR